MQRSEQKQQTRQRVIGAARNLFAEHGLAKTRTADIADRAGLSHGAIFVHFPTRDELLAEVVYDIGRSITDRLHALIKEDAIVAEILQAHLDCLQEHESSYVSFLQESRLLPRDVLRNWVGIQSAISVHIADPAEREMQSGSIRHMPIHLLYNTWIGLVHHYLMNRELFAPKGSVLKRHGEELLAHFLSMISVERRERK